jgi:hypothetical protein
MKICLAKLRNSPPNSISFSTSGLQRLPSISEHHLPPNIQHHNPQSPNVSLLPRYSAAPPPPSSHNLNSNHNVFLNGMPNHKVFSLPPRPCLHHLCILESLHLQLQPIRNPLCLQRPFSNFRDDVLSFLEKDKSGREGVLRHWCGVFFDAFCV